MFDPKSIKINHPHFFVKITDCGIQASFSNAQGRKNYLIPKAKHITEEAPLAVESFSITSEHYYTLMDRINRLYE